jgi:hypothetical protein
LEHFKFKELEVEEQAKACFKLVIKELFELFGIAVDYSLRAADYCYSFLDFDCSFFLHYISG